MDTKDRWSMTSTCAACELCDYQQRSEQNHTGQWLQAEGSCFLPSSSLILSEASLLSTFRGAGSAQADEYGHVPISSESTGRDKEKGREEQKSDRKEEKKRLKGKETRTDPKGMIEIRTSVNI